jgi:hypothetical protein
MIDEDTRAVNIGLAADKYKSQSKVPAYSIVQTANDFCSLEGVGRYRRKLRRG